MKKLITLAMAVAFALTLATVTMAAAHKKAAKKEIKPVTVKAEVLKVEKLKKGTLLRVKVAGKVHVYHVAKVASKEAESLKGGEMVELTLHGWWIYGIKAEAPAPAAAPAPAPGK
ncbi:MAG: hypothetical protein M1381_08975 [Deltaproteobacteria bacterium]|nr:hypothetical protein [Deltaproteobacteria bacterium]